MASHYKKRQADWNRFDALFELHAHEREKPGIPESLCLQGNAQLQLARH